MSAIQSTDIQFKTLVDLREEVINTVSPYHREIKDIPSGSIINIFNSFQMPVTNTTLYTGFWNDGEKDYIVTVTDKYVDDERVKLMGGGGKRRKSRKTRSKSKRRQTSKN